MQTFWFCSLPNYERINFIGYLQSFSTWSTCGILLYQRLLVRIWYLALGVCCLSHSFWGSCNIYFVTLVKHWHCDICCCHFDTSVTLTWQVLLSLRDNCHICHIYLETLVTFTYLWHLSQFVCDTCYYTNNNITVIVTTNYCCLTGIKHVFLPQKNVSIQ